MRPEPDMTTTYLNYNLVARDLKAEMSRVSEQSQVSRETAYFKENIGTVQIRRGICRRLPALFLCNEGARA
jgi:hypothetical protein